MSYVSERGYLTRTHDSGSGKDRQLGNVANSEVVSRFCSRGNQKEMVLP
jgi:hypothetical protein